MENKEYNNLNYGGGFTEEDIKRVSLFKEAANHYAEGFEYNQPSEHGLFVNSLQGFIAGAKWLQEKMYSEEEVIELLNKREDCINQTSSILDYTSAKEWFEQFKKK
jgi:hypothetical protein